VLVLQHLVRFFSGSPKFEAKLYTDLLLSQVSHRKNRKHNNGNTFTNNKPNHSTRRRFPYFFKKGV
jgi:hypothetical protein